MSEARLRLNNSGTPDNVTTTLPGVGLRIVKADVDEAVCRHIARLTALGKSFTLTVEYDARTGRYMFWIGAPAGVL